MSIHSSQLLIIWGASGDYVRGFFFGSKCFFSFPQSGGARRHWADFGGAVLGTQTSFMQRNRQRPRAYRAEGLRRVMDGRGLCRRRAGHFCAARRGGSKDVTRSRDGPPERHSGRSSLFDDACGPERSSGVVQLRRRPLGRTAFALKPEVADIAAPSPGALSRART